MIEVVEELDRWLRVYNFAGLIDVAVVQRARDELVELRELVADEADRSQEFADVIRDKALEEAARVCEGGYTTGSTRSTLKAIAAAIRALKEEH